MSPYYFFFSSFHKIWTIVLQQNWCSCVIFFLFLLKIAYPPIRTCRVAFHARLKPSVTLGSKQIVVFDDVITNIGQAYDQHSGFFTAPCDGIYFFACTFLRGRGVELNLQMVKNNNEISRGHAATGGGSQTGSMNAVVYLRKGEVVKIRHFPGVGSENIHDDWCFFTGYSV